MLTNIYMSAEPAVATLKLPTVVVAVAFMSAVAELLSIAAIAVWTELTVVLPVNTLFATQYFADTACMFWKSNSLVTRCKDTTTTSIKLVTKKINGGYNGLDDRIKKFTKYWTELQKDPTLWS